MQQGSGIGRQAGVLALLGGGTLLAVYLYSGTPDVPAAGVWAVVDTREIRQPEVERAFRAAVEATQIDTAAEKLTVQLRLLHELITQDVLVARAAALGIEAAASDVEDAFAERRRSVPDDVFQQQLDERGLTVEHMKLGIRRELTVQKLIEQEVEARIVVTDKDISAYFNEHKAKFNLTEPHFRLAQISVTPAVDPQVRNRMNSDASTPAEALEKAQMLMERLRAGGDFGELALDYSEDLGTVAQGGEVGFVPQSALAQVSPPFRSAVETMEPGEVRLISAGGAHTILLLVSRQPAGQRDLDSPDVRDGIREMLRTIQQQLLQAAYVAAALDEADVTNYLARQIVVSGGVVPPGADR